MLFDKLETSSPGAAAVIKDTFGGVLVNQIISKENDFKSERLEPFNMITLTVQGKASLAESFEALTAGELLTGDNKYQLPDGTKVGEARTWQCYRCVAWRVRVRVPAHPLF